jgi:hypothetical protein
VRPLNSGVSRTRYVGAKLPNPVSLATAIWLCLLAVFAPDRFKKWEEADTAVLEKKPNAPDIGRVHIVRRALLGSLGLVLLSSLIGYVVGWSLTAAGIFACKGTVSSLQVLGAAILLWATLAVRGWDIQTFASVTLSERVNQWIYRFLYCLGTATIVLSISWTGAVCG